MAENMKMTDMECPFVFNWLDVHVVLFHIYEVKDLF